MNNDLKHFYCINCGTRTDILYKKYSETVLKLKECECCGKIADKYVEYDLVVIIIDLVLLNTMAYRHILLNSKFKNFWKLSIFLVLLESYTSLVLSHRYLPEKYKLNKNETNLMDFDINVEDLKFYVICLNIAISSLCFIITVFLCTKVYHKFFPQNQNLPIDFVLIFKTITLSSTGVFLQLPSIIWDISQYDYHLHFITLYTSLSQLLAYKVICNGPKLWCLVVIFSSQFLKSTVSMYLSAFLDQVFFIK